MKKEKVERNIEINISNKVLYSIIALVVVIGLGVGVFAYGGSSPSAVGHTMGEIAPPCSGILVSSGSSWTCIPSPPTCSGANYVLQWTGSSWGCSTISTGYECDWSGWMPTCACLTLYDPDSVCGEHLGNPVYPRLTNQQYCSSGTVTDTRTVYCCNTVGGECAST